MVKIYSSCADYHIKTRFAFYGEAALSGLELRCFRAIGEVGRGVLPGARLADSAIEQLPEISGLLNCRFTMRV